MLNLLHDFTVAGAPMTDDNVACVDASACSAGLVLAV